MLNSISKVVCIIISRYISGHCEFPHFRGFFVWAIPWITNPDNFKFNEAPRWQGIAEAGHDFGPRILRICRLSYKVGQWFACVCIIWSVPCRVLLAYSFISWTTSLVLVSSGPDRKKELSFLLKGTRLSCVVLSLSHVSSLFARRGTF